MINKSFVKFALGFFLLLVISFVTILIANSYEEMEANTQEVVVGSL